MSDIKQEIIFDGAGLNWDSDNHFMPLGDSPYRLSILVGGNYANGVIINMQGNRRTIDITDHLLTLSNVYLTVGSYYNRLTRKCYYFIFSQPYNSTSTIIDDWIVLTDGTTSIRKEIRDGFLCIDKTLTALGFALVGVEGVDWENVEAIEMANHSGTPVTLSSGYIYDNKLFCYNEDTETLDLIFTDTKNYFGLNPNNLMRDCEMIGDMLYFNSRDSEPKIIDVTRAYNYTTYPAYDILSTYVYGDKVTYYGGLFVATGAVSAGQTPMANTAKWDRIGNSYIETTNLSFDSEFRYAFNVIKMPPYERPRLVHGSDANVSSNNVRGKVFRFSYRYKYFDNAYSVYSAFSDISLPEYDEIWNGEIPTGIVVGNYIGVTVYAHSPALVKEIEVVFQEINGDWKRAKIINRQSQDVIGGSTASFNFYNNESYIQVTNVEVTRVADAVPKQANSQEIVNKNILTYGGCLEGFENLNKDDIRVSLTPVLTPITIDTAPGVTHKDVYGAFPLLISDTVVGTSVARRIDLGSWFPGAVNGATDELIVTIDGKTAYHVLTVGECATLSTFMDAIRIFLLNNFPAYDTQRVGGVGNYLSMLSTPYSPIRANITKFLFCVIGSAKAELNKKKGFKTGANHPFCIFYYDGNLRRWDAQVSKENIRISGLEMEGTTVYVPMFNEVAGDVAEDTAYRFVIDWEVYHLPPTGAKYWRWGYAGNGLCDNMVQYIVSSIVRDGNMCKIDITPLQTLKNTTVTVPVVWNQFPNSSIDQYTWTAGDRIRFLTVESVPGPATTIGELTDVVYDYEIIKQNDTDNTIYTQYFDPTATLPSKIGVNTLVEIYSPLKSVQDTKIEFYEFGDIMPIIEDTAGILVHAGQGGLQNQDTLLSQSATGTFDGGDIYHIVRTPSKPLDTTNTIKGIFHESMWYSDFYYSKDYDRGKIGIETTFGERFLNIIRYSNQFMQDTQINGLSTFEGNNYKELNDIYGDIIAIYEQGDTLKVYQERKASSILVGRTEYYDAGTSGGNAVVTSERVFGAIRYSPTNYSTVFPESISRNNRYLYGFDIYNGVAWRDSANGIFPISGRYAEAGGDIDYRMQTYFKLKAKALMASGRDNVNIISAWDEEYKLFYLTFKDKVLATNNETIIFHEPSNRWITFVELEQTPAEGYNVILELNYEIVKGFEAGIGFSFDEDTRFAVFNISTPKNYNPTMDEATLGIASYDPTTEVDCSPDADLDAVSITAYDPTVTVTLAPHVVLSFIEDIGPEDEGVTLPLFVHYTNDGDAKAGLIVNWRIKNSSGTIVQSGSQTTNFGGQTTDSSVTVLGAVYPDASAPLFNTAGVKLSTDPWSSALITSFKSLSYA